MGKPLTALRAARVIATVTSAVTVFAGVLMRVTDAKEFPNIGDGLWWAIQTGTTVGYGDLVPTSPGGWLIAALVMLVEIGFLTLITAAITSTFIETVRRRVRSGSRTTRYRRRRHLISSDAPALSPPDRHHDQQARRHERDRASAALPRRSSRITASEPPGRVSHHRQTAQ